MTKELLASALEDMARYAEKLGVKGAAVVAYQRGKTDEDWVADFRVVNRLSYVDREGKGYNYVGIAWQKACEMMDTHVNSGERARAVYVGECGWRGGAIEKLSDGYILAAFSGGTSEQDLEISACGLQTLKSSI